MRVETTTGDRLLTYAADIRNVYADAFAAPPWAEDAAMADAYLDRLAIDVLRPGFAAAVALDGERLIGFCTAWTTPDPFPEDRCYPEVSAALGAPRTRAWLCGGQEVDELAVHSRGRGKGVGAALLDVVSRDVSDGRTWLLTSVRARAALDFYRRLGWRQATHPAPEGTGVAVFLGPRHHAELPV
ncbi:GNAT family N-acetyltransferase [Streptomyces sp. NPDC091376]|uniref:GNAT family N-acetyltransferase n=1 Tax=Streptomyces sp. NPDC091376 TaxID=3365994 RepID=UPI003823FC07